MGNLRSDKFPQKLAWYMEHANITQGDLATPLGLSGSVVSKWLKGTSEPAGFGRLTQLGDFFASRTRYPAWFIVSDLLGLMDDDKPKEVTCAEVTCAECGSYLISGACWTCNLRLVGGEVVLLGAEEAVND